jgi:hypothetical protein
LTCRLWLQSISFFNLLFLFLLFPLEGPLFRKIVLLIAGNLVGALWYIIQLSFEEAFFFLNTDLFKIIMLVAKPLIDFVWIVAVWSPSLSVLASYRIKMEGVEKLIWVLSIAFMVLVALITAYLRRHYLFTLAALYPTKKEPFP